MASSGPSNSIDDQAAYWAVEGAYSNMPPERRSELETWLALDPRHRGAFERARAAIQVMEKAVLDGQSAETSPSLRGTSTRGTSTSDNDNDGTEGRNEDGSHSSSRLFSQWSGRAFTAGAALAASVAALMLFGLPVRAPLERTELAAAEKTVKLEDGSVVTLLRDAKMEAVLSNDFRRITLLSGEATFKVAKDRTRPFVVRSGDVYAQATGTVYSVSRAGLTGGTVRVTEGSVLVWSRDERDQAVLLHAGDVVTLAPAKAIARPSLPPPELAQISFDNVPIKSAAARFNRVNSTKIVIADRAIGNTRIVGLFGASDIEQFAQAAAVLSGGKVEHGDGVIVIKKK